MSDDELWVSHAMQVVMDTMRSKNLTLMGFRDRKGHLRYLLSNNEIVAKQTVSAMKRRDLLEQMESTEEANARNEVHYRLKLK